MDKRRRYESNIDVTSKQSIYLKTTDQNPKRSKTGLELIREEIEDAIRNAERNGKSIVWDEISAEMNNSLPMNL